jgi:putative NADPH-quinone reductase
MNIADSQVPNPQPDARAPLVLLASSRPDGHTAALVDAAFPAASLADSPADSPADTPQYARALVDLGALQIGYFSYANRCAGDDFVPLIERALVHAVWVIATPLYWYTMSAQAKTFLDRLSDLLEFRKDLGRRLRGKHLAVLCTGEDEVLPPHFAEPFELTAAYLGMRYLGHHYAQVQDRAPMRPSQQAAARRFARELAARSDQPALHCPAGDGNMAQRT